MLEGTKKHWKNMKMCDPGPQNQEWDLYIIWKLNK